MTEAPRLGQSVYLAGAITGLSYNESMGWRLEAAEQLTELGYGVYSPMRHKMHLAHEFDDRPLPHTSSKFRDPFQRDMLDIRRADFVLVNMWRIDPQHGSVGTFVEVGYAHALGKYIIVVDPEHGVEGHELHPFIKGPARDVVPTLDEAIALLSEFRPLL